MNLYLGGSPGENVACLSGVYIEGPCLDDVAEIDERRQSSYRLEILNCSKHLLPLVLDLMSFCLGYP